MSQLTRACTIIFGVKATLPPLETSDRIMGAVDWPERQHGRRRDAKKGFSSHLILCFVFDLCVAGASPLQPTRIETCQESAFTCHW